MSYIGQLWKRKPSLSEVEKTWHNPEWLLILSSDFYKQSLGYERELTLLTEFGNILTWHETNLYARYHLIYPKEEIK